MKDWLKEEEVVNKLDGKPALTRRLKDILKVMNEDRSLAHFMLTNLVEKLEKDGD
jgi:hypothetical protein